MDLLPALLSDAAKTDGLLVQIYGDLARPGVQQVGKALETVIEIGALALLPLRLANAAARSWEEKAYRQIADRLSAVDANKVEPVRPEIAVPILESLAHTADEELRSLFIELLANAANKDFSDTCHPSFVHVVRHISPDEARLLKYWCGQQAIPFLEVSRRSGRSSRTHLADILDFPDNLLFRNNFPVYISNLSGLGIISKSTMQWLSGDAYEELISLAKQTWPTICQSMTQSADYKAGEPSEYIYDCGMMKIEPYGLLFQKACLTN